MFPEWSGHWTHCEIIGPPRMGKSSFMAVCDRFNILAGNRIFKFSGGKDDTYDSLISFIAQAKPNFPARYLNVSDDGRVAGYNPFLVPEGRDLSAHVSALAEYVRPPASDNTFGTRFPSPETAQAFFAHICTSKIPVWKAMHLFDFANRKEWATLDIPEEFKYKARAIASLDVKNWEYKTGALREFLDPFVTSGAIRRMLCAPDPIVIDDLYCNDISLFVKATPSRYLSAPASRALLSFFLADIFQTGIEHAGEKKKIFTGLDELHLYAPPGMADILDTILSAGFLITLAHHHDAQWKDKHLQQSVETSCGIKVIFGRLPAEKREALVKDYLGEELNQDWHRQPRISHITEYSDDLSISETDYGEGHKSVTTTDRLIPESIEVQTGWDDYSMEEKISRLSCRFILQKEEAIALFPDGRCSRFKVPYLDPYLPDSPVARTFKENLPHTISFDEAVKRSHIERSTHARSRTTKRQAAIFESE